MSRLISINFKLSVVVTFIGCAVIIFRGLQGFPDFSAYLGAQSDYGLIVPVIVLATPLLWFAYYRHGEGHIPAFLIGFGLLVSLVGSRVSDGQIGYGVGEQLFLLYSGVSHITYSLLNWQELAEHLRGNAD